MFLFIFSFLPVSKVNENIFIHYLCQFLVFLMKGIVHSLIAYLGNSHISAELT